MVFALNNHMVSLVVVEDTFVRKHDLTNNHVVLLRGLTQLFFSFILITSLLIIEVIFPKSFFIPVVGISELQ